MAVPCPKVFCKRICLDCDGSGRSILFKKKYSLQKVMKKKLDSFDLEKCSSCDGSGFR